MEHYNIRCERAGALCSRRANDLKTKIEISRATGFRENPAVRGFDSRETDRLDSINVHFGRLQRTLGVLVRKKCCRRGIKGCSKSKEVKTETFSRRVYAIIETKSSNRNYINARTANYPDESRRIFFVSCGRNAFILPFSGPVSSSYRKIFVLFSVCEFSR